MVTIRSSQKWFTEDEVSRLTGICLEHLRNFARNKHLGTLIRTVGTQAEKCLYTSSDLMVLNVLFTRCQHS